MTRKYCWKIKIDDSGQSGYIINFQKKIVFVQEQLFETPALFLVSLSLDPTSELEYITLLTQHKKEKEGYVYMYVCANVCMYVYKYIWSTELGFVIFNFFSTFLFIYEILSFEYSLSWIFLFLVYLIWI